MVRNGHTDQNIADYIREVVNEKEEGHRINQPDFVPPSRTMVFIGG
jgi:cyclic pyranopterin phosphate synthase